MDKTTYFIPGERVILTSAPDEATEAILDRLLQALIGLEQKVASMDARLKAVECAPDDEADDLTDLRDTERCART